MPAKTTVVQLWTRFHKIQFYLIEWLGPGILSQFYLPHRVVFMGKMQSWVSKRKIGYTCSGPKSHISVNGHGDPGWYWAYQVIDLIVVTGGGDLLGFYCSKPGVSNHGHVKTFGLQCPEFLSQPCLKVAKFRDPCSKLPRVTASELGCHIHFS